MRHFPIFRDLRGRRVLVSGGGATAAAKLRLLLKTEANLVVYAADVGADVRHWADAGVITLVERPIRLGDAVGAALVYGANADPAEDARAARIGRAAGALVNIVDDLEASDFITPAIVDRDPVVVAIGTEGAAPVLARRIKADLEERLPSWLGALTRIGQRARERVAELSSAARRALWTNFYEEAGPRAFETGGAAAAQTALEQLVVDALSPRLATGSTGREGHVSFVGAGPGDPDLLTLKARKRLHEADVVVHDRLVGGEILELARREATLIEVGKIPGGPSWKQADINALLVHHAREGHRVVRLKSGDPGVFGRLDEEIAALDDAAIPFDIVPGVTAAAAAAASAGLSLTRRGRNQALTILTGHDANGLAEHDWASLAKPGAAAAVYMGVRAARFIRGRLMLHGAAADTPVTVVENASRPNEKRVVARLVDLPEILERDGIAGPAILLVGLAEGGRARVPVPAGQPAPVRAAAV